MTEENSDETRVTVRIDAELDELIEAEREQGPYKVPKAEVIRAALKEYLDNDEGNPNHAPAMA